MMFAASANDLVMLFVSLELITVSFYMLTSFQRARVRSLEVGREIFDHGRGFFGVHGLWHRADFRAGGNDEFRQS